ncbi:MAG: hypothetical protein K0R12_1019 [Gammaproteobacteria bacterium]|jgi:hypothetical protein|nr:hypothetical protein [Gammaproteobacteria bacterium]
MKSNALILSLCALMAAGSTATAQAGTYSYQNLPLLAAHVRTIDNTTYQSNNGDDDWQQPGSNDAGQDPGAMSQSQTPDQSVTQSGDNNANANDNDDNMDDNGDND